MQWVRLMLPVPSSNYGRRCGSAVSWRMNDRKLVTEEYSNDFTTAVVSCGLYAHKAPYWSIHKYEDRVDESLHKAFVEHVEKVHRDSLDELEGK